MEALFVCCLVWAGEVGGVGILGMSAWAPQKASLGPRRLDVRKQRQEVFKRKG